MIFSENIDIIIAMISALLGIFSFFLPKIKLWYKFIIFAVCIIVCAGLIGIHSHPTYDDLVKSAQANLNTNKVEQAINDSTKALKLDNKGIEAYLIRAQGYFKQGEYNLAIADYNKIKEIDSQNIMAYEKCGDIYYSNLTMYDEALKEYTVAYDLDPHNNYYLSKIKEISDLKRKDSMYSEILLGTWNGVYGKGSSKAKLSLEIRSYQDNKITAIFEFSPHPDNPQMKSGSYKMEGEFTDNLEVILKGCEWINQPSGFVFLDINGQLDINQYTITDKDNDLFIKKYTDKQEEDTSESVTKVSGKTPLSSIKFVKPEQLHGYIINSDYSTLRGNGYPMDYVAMSAGNTYNEVISVCNYSPFDLIYNLENNYKELNGKIGFDDISVAGTDIAGVKSNFKGEAKIIFLVDDKVKLSIDLKTTDFPKNFSVNVSGGKKLTIRITFPYNNFVLENFDKYFNIIDAYLK